MRVENISFVEEKEYLKPGSLPEALDLFRSFGREAVILAGASDVFARKSLQRRVIIDIMHTGLNYIEEDEVGLRIGACVTMRQLVGRLSGGRYHSIAQSAGALGSPQIRNMATIGGNLCNAAPSADCAPALYVLGARMVLKSSAGARTLPIEDFITGPGQTALEPGEILEEIRVPQPEQGLRICFEKVVRTRGLDLALVNGAILLKLDGGGLVQTLRVCLGAVAPTPLILEKELAGFVGQALTDNAIEEITELCGAAVKPISDVRSSKEYRVLRCKTLVSRGLKTLLTAGPDAAGGKE